MRALKALAVMVVLLAGWPVTTRAAEPLPDAALLAEQTQLEAGSDLSSRARRELFRARSRQDSGDYEEAAAIVREWLAGDPKRDHNLLRFNLAVSYLALERPRDALLQLTRAVELAPRHARAWLRLGEAAYELGQYKQAGEAFGRAYDLSPEKQPEIIYYAGVSLLSGNEAAAAVQRLVQLVDTYPARTGLDWVQALAAAAIEAGQAGQAVPYLNRLLAAQPDDPAVWDLAYRFYAGQSDYEQAAVLLTIGDYIQTLDRSELVQLGDLYSVVGVPLQAARYYERAFTGDTEPTIQDYRKLATAWMVAQEWDAARSVLAALAAKPARELWELQGDLEYTVENFEAALTAFRAATQQDSDFGRGYLMMGYCALELDRPDEARRNLTRALAFTDQKQAAAALLERLASAD